MEGDVRILVFGAGPLGSLMAARLYQSGQDVTLLARNQRLTDLQKYGICLKSWMTKEEESIRVPLIEKLKPEDHYDLILVVMRKNSALKILPILAKNSSEQVVFLMNNAAGPDVLVKTLGSQRVLIGFPGAAGYREGHKIVYMNGEPERKMEVHLGESSGVITDRLERIASVIEKGKYLQVITEPNMDAWSKYHVALLFPSLAPAFYLGNHDRLRVARTRDAVVLAYRSMKEGFAVLKKLGYAVTPGSLKKFQWLPEPIVVAFLQKMLRDPRMEVAMEKHAEAAQDEIAQLIDEFMELVEKSGLFTPNLQFMVSQFRSRAPVLPDGSRSIPLHWEAIILPSSLVLLLILVLALIF